MKYNLASSYSATPWNSFLFHSISLECEGSAVHWNFRSPRFQQSCARPKRQNQSKQYLSVGNQSYAKAHTRHNGSNEKMHVNFWNECAHQRRPQQSEECSSLRRCNFKSNVWVKENFSNCSVSNGIFRFFCEQWNSFSLESDRSNVLQHSCEWQCSGSSRIKK